MTSTYTGSPLDTRPYLEILRVDGPGIPGLPIGIYPKLIAKPKKMRFSKDLSVMALVSDLRRDTIEGIGSDTEDPPGGLRVFSDTDRFLFLGGTSTEDARLYEKAGPIFQNTELLTIAPGSNALHAAFSQGGRWLFVVWASAPNVVDVIQWTGAEASSLDGAWQHFSYLDTGNVISRLIVTPGNSYLVANSGTTSRFYDIQNSLALVAGTPAKRVIDVAADEAQWLFQGASNAEVYELAAGAWTLETALAGTGLATGNRALFSPSGEEILFAVSGASGSPITFAKNALGDWQQNYIEPHAGAITVAGLLFHPDGDTAALAASDKLEIYTRQVTVPDAIAERATVISNTNRNRARGSFNGQSIITTLQDGGTGTGTATIYDVAANGDLTSRGSTSGFSAQVLDAAMTPNAAHAFVSLDNQKLFIFRPGSSSQERTVGFGALGRLAVSPTGQHLALWTAGGVLRVIQFDITPASAGSWVFNQVASFTDGALQNSQPEFSPDGDMLIMRASGSTRERIFLFTGSALTPQSQLALPANRGGTFQGPVWSPDGERIVMGYRQTVAPNAYMLGVFKRVGNAFEFESELAGPTGAITDIAFSPDGKGLAAISANSIKAYIQVSTGWVSTPVPNFAIASPLSIGWANHALAIASLSTATKTYSWAGAQEIVAFKLAHAFTVPSARIWSFNPESALVHFGNASEGHHARLSDYLEVASLSFASGRAPVDVREVLFSPSGKAVVFETPDGLELATKSGSGGDFLNAKDITGTFATLYDLPAGGKTFTERGYASHIIGADVIDMSFSLSASIFSYHVYLPPEAPADAVRGRLIYDTSKVPAAYRYALRGDVFDEDQTKSFIAYSPFETHCVITNERNTGNHDIMLFKFLADYEPDLRDTKPVPFGPPAFSYCDDVVVAHGGDPAFTFFDHDKIGEVLNPTGADVANWSSGGVVVDVEFTGDCDGLVVLTPGAIVPIERPGTGPIAGPEIELDKPIPAGEHADTEIELSPGEIGIFPPMPGPGYPGNYEGQPGSPIYSINYVPYSVVSVSFRVMPVPN